MQSINITPGVPNTRSSYQVQGLMDYTPGPGERNLRISGITMDVTQTALANCIVKLFDTTTDAFSYQVVSTSNGSYVIDLQIILSKINSQTQTWYLVAYKSGSPDVAGTTVNTLQGA
jgi:hypothetical protein